jgi:hypothetical protein
MLTSGPIEISIAKFFENLLFVFVDFFAGKLILATSDFRTSLVIVVSSFPSEIGFFASRLLSLFIICSALFFFPWVVFN